MGNCLVLISHESDEVGRRYGRFSIGMLGVHVLILRNDGFWLGFGPML